MSERLLNAADRINALEYVVMQMLTASYPREALQALAAAERAAIEQLPEPASGVQYLRPEIAQSIDAQAGMRAAIARLYDWAAEPIAAPGSKS